MLKSDVRNLFRHYLRNRTFPGIKGCVRIALNGPTELTKNRKNTLVP